MNTFDVGTSASDRAPLGGVLSRLVAGGGTVIDTSPMYGRAETVLGDLIQELGLRPRLWLATKVWTRGRAAGVAQIEQSYARLRTGRLDLLQVHNLLDWREHLPTIRALQESGKLLYSGITHYRADAHAELERALAAERFDWMQVNYSLAEPEAGARLLPLCRDRGIAVMVNRPFADGAMFARVKGKALPPWAAEIGCESWGQFFLRWIVAHPAVALKAGQVLATLEPARSDALDPRTRAQAAAQVKAAAAAVAAAQENARAASAQADLARQELARTESLRKTNFISEQAVDKARTELVRTQAAKLAAAHTVSAAHFELETARAALAQTARLQAGGPLETMQVRAPAGTRLDLSELESRLRRLGPVSRNPYLLRFAAPEGELVVFEDGRAMVNGTDDAARARALYARYVGS